MSAQQNKTIVARFFDERWNKRNLAIYDELRSPDPHIEAERRWAENVLSTFREFRLELPDVVAEGDQVAVQFDVTAVFRTDMPGVGALGEEIQFQGMALLRLRDGIIIEDTAYVSEPRILSLFEQLS